MNVDQIKECRSLKQLASLWTLHIDALSRLPKDEARELIQAKDKHKGKLELFEEWAYWFQERTAIMEIDGCVSRGQSADTAEEAIFNQAMSDVRGQI